MGRGRTVTLKGAAAGAYIEMMRGKRPETEDEKCMRVATVVHMHMQSGANERARALIQSVVKNGLDATVALLVR